MAAATARVGRLLLLLLAMAAIAGVWAQQVQELEQEQVPQQATVDAEGMQAPADGKGKGGVGGLFSRVARMLDTGSAEDDDGVPFTDAEWEATKDLGEPVDPNKPWGSSELMDAWSVDRALGMVRRALDGDATGAFKAMIDDTKDLQEAWANPVTFKYIAQHFPLLRAIKPINLLAGKDSPTAQDGRDAMKSYIQYAKLSISLIEKLMDPNKMAEMFAAYSNPSDLQLVQLYNAFENAKDSATAQQNFQALQQYLFKKELGDLIDLDMLGANGVEPPFLNDFRTKVKNFAPGIYSNMVKDPTLRKYIDNPFMAVREAKDIMDTYTAL